MKSISWKDIAELIGITAIVASLVFVGLQMRQAQELATAEAVTATFANYLEIRSQINDHTKIWIKGNKGGELTETETLIYRNLVENVGEKEWFNGLTYRHLGRSDEFAINGLAMFLYQNPGARREWTNQMNEIKKYNQALHPKGSDAVAAENRWLDRVLSALEKLDDVAH